MRPSSSGRSLDPASTQPTTVPSSSQANTSSVVFVNSSIASTIRTTSARVASSRSASSPGGEITARSPTVRSSPSTSSTKAGGLFPQVTLLKATRQLGDPSGVGVGWLALKVGQKMHVIRVSWPGQQPAHIRVSDIRTCRGARGHANDRSQPEDMDVRDRDSSLLVDLQLCTQITGASSIVQRGSTHQAVPSLRTCTSVNGCDQIASG